jgi:hypothetical protein
VTPVRNRAKRCYQQLLNKNRRITGVRQNTKKHVTTHPQIERQLELYLADLTENHGSSAMAKLVLEAVQRVDATRLVSQGQARTIERLNNSKTLLSLLTYCYGVGIYNPADIERAIEHDPAGSYLAARTFPTGDALRQFRKDHRSLLSQSMVRFFEIVWLFGQHGSVVEGASHELPASLVVQMGRLAEEHILLALLWDGPAFRD